MESILPIIALILGWSLNEITRYLMARRDNRKPISAAISDLLLIRHQIITTRLSIKELIKRFSVPTELHPEFTAFIKGLVELLLPKQTDLGTRYDNAVSLIAASDPILGFTLRSQHLVEDYLASFGKIAGTDKEALKFFAGLEEKLENMIIPFFEEMILSLAKVHGPITFFKVRRILKHEVVLPQEAETLMADLQQQPGFRASVEELQKLSAIPKPENPQ